MAHRQLTRRPTTDLHDTRAGMRALLLFLLQLSAVHAANYTKYPGLNCWDGHGGVNIDDSSTAPTGLSPTECKARCDSDSQCYCIVLTLKSEKCYKRKSCNPPKCKKGPQDDVYIKPMPPTPPTPAPPPTPKPGRPTPGVPPLFSGAPFDSCLHRCNGPLPQCLHRQCHTYLLSQSMVHSPILCSSSRTIRTCTWADGPQ